MMFRCTVSIFKDQIYLLTPNFQSLLAEATKKKKKTYKKGGLVLILITHPNVMWNSTRALSELHLEFTVKT